MDNARCQHYREIVTVSSTTRSSHRNDPLGPESLTWKYFGDLRTGMLGVWIGALQNMHPELGAGVEEHSILLREPLQRVARSVYPIMGVVYDGTAPPRRVGRSRGSTPPSRASTTRVVAITR